MAYVIMACIVMADRNHGRMVKTSTADGVVTVAESYFHQKTRPSSLSIAMAPKSFSCAIVTTVLERSAQVCLSPGV